MTCVCIATLSNVRYSSGRPTSLALTILLATSLWVSASTIHAAQPTETKAFFREGQTFLTWQEDGATKGESYRVYRHSEKITPANLAKARMVAVVKEGSSRFEEMYDLKGNLIVTTKDKSPSPEIIPRLCIEPVGEDNVPKMLAEDTGLLVWTVKESAQDTYYAVTTVVEGKEDLSLGAGNVVGPVHEKQEPIGAVRFLVQTTPNWANNLARDRIEKARQQGVEPSAADLKASIVVRDRYIMWMDYEQWSPDYIGYAFPFAITVNSFKQGGPMPMPLLDGIGTMAVSNPDYSNYGPGDFSANALPTWYFGYGSTTKDRTAGWQTLAAIKQPIGNYVQCRFMHTLLWARRHYGITEPRVPIRGNSMGASGALGLAIAFPRFVTEIIANQPFTDYANPRRDEPYMGETYIWRDSMWGNFGLPELANPVKLMRFGDPQLDWYLKYDGMNVYDFRNAARFMAANVEVSFPYLNIGHCHQDSSIPPKSQAYPFEAYIRDSRQTFSYAVTQGGHGSGQGWLNESNGRFVTWDQSRPGFSGVPPIVAWRWNRDKDETGRTYMYKVAWGAGGRKIGGKDIPVVDTADAWAMPLIHEAKEGLEHDYFVDITPRNLQQLTVKRGQRFAFRILTLDGKPLEIADFTPYANGEASKARFKNAGECVADEHDLLLVPCVPIHRPGCIVEVKRQG